nr:hypothetical protein P5630_06550 [Bacillus subtilis]WGD87655.1 hypothetical protein P5656_16780 [Bacillus subtilis]
MADELSISGASPILFQHIKKWRFYRETDQVLGAIYTIELATVYRLRTIVVIFKDVSAVTIREIETLSDLSDGILHIEGRHKARTLWKNGKSRHSAFIVGNMR